MNIQGLINMSVIDVLDYLDTLEEDYIHGMITKKYHDEEHEAIEFLYPDYYLTWIINSLF